MTCPISVIYISSWVFVDSTVGTKRALHGCRVWIDSSNYCHKVSPDESKMSQVATLLHSTEDDDVDLQISAVCRFCTVRVSDSKAFLNPHLKVLIDKCSE